jgi:acetyl esterase
MNSAEASAQFARVIQSLEAGTSDPDPRTDVDTASLVERYPELGRATLADVIIPGTYGDVAARLYLPEETPRACLVWAHGGSFVGGNIDMPESNWVALALAALGHAVLTVEYSKALFGVHFPVPSIDLLDAWNWAIAEFASSTSSVHLGGASAGGNLAAGVGVRLRDGHGQPPTSLVLAYPGLHDLLPEGSAQLQAALKGLPAEDQFPQSMVSAIARNYLGHDGNASDPYAFPGRATLTGMPPIFIINSERDDHRLSGEAFARQAIDAGVSVAVSYEPGSQHGHLDRPHTVEAQRSVARIAHWLDGFPTEASQ